MSHLYTLREVNSIPASIETAWSFFADPSNLAKVNPSNLDINISTDIKGEVLPDQKIRITVKPLWGMKVLWESKITHVERLKLFVDEQVKGPFGFWQHQHHFKEVEGGTEVTDLIYYKMPFRNIGELAAPLVRRQLDKTFAYRKRKIKQLFDRKD